MIFPKLKNKVFGYVDLNLEAEEWIEKKGLIVSELENPLIDPKVCEEFVNDVHKKYSLDFSYGGWMEDRSFLWKAGYLEKEKMFIHLGVDINVPVGTEVATDFKAEVLKIDNDYPLDGGWGTHVFLKNLEKDVCVLYAHLDQEVFCKEGDVLEKDTIFPKVGEAPFNGNWFPHVHVQTISIEYYEQLKQTNDWERFDGYGLKNDSRENARKHRDPLGFISLT